MRLLNNLENIIPSKSFWKDELKCMKDQGYSFSETLLEHNQGQMSFRNEDWLWRSEPSRVLQGYYAGLNQF